MNNLDFNKDNSHEDRRSEKIHNHNLFSKIFKKKYIKYIVISIIIFSFFIASILFNINYLKKIPDYNASIDWVVIIGLIFITSVSLMISVWIYFTRSIYSIKNRTGIFPERYDVFLETMSHEVTDKQKIFETQLIKLFNSYNVQQSSLETLSKNFSESIATFQNYEKSQAGTIKKLTQGFDSDVFKKFLKRFVRVNIFLDDIIAKGGIDEKNSNNYRNLSRLMTDALEDCGLESFIPRVDTDYRDAGGAIEDNPKSEFTKDKKKDWLIKSIDRPAFVISGQGHNEFITKAKVTIYRYYDNKKDPIND
jgi:hypothetical protein